MALRCLVSGRSDALFDSQLMIEFHLVAMKLAQGRLLLLSLTCELHFVVVYLRLQCLHKRLALTQPIQFALLSRLPGFADYFLCIRFSTVRPRARS